MDPQRRRPSGYGIAADGVPSEETLASKVAAALRDGKGKASRPRPQSASGTNNSRQGPGSSPFRPPLASAPRPHSAGGLRSPPPPAGRSGHTEPAFVRPNGTAAGNALLRPGSPSARASRRPLSAAGPAVAMRQGPGRPRSAAAIRPQSAGLPGRWKATSRSASASSLTPSALHRKLAKSLVEHAPAQLVADMAADPGFAFRSYVGEALEKRRLQRSKSFRSAPETNRSDLDASDSEEVESPESARRAIAPQPGPEQAATKYRDDCGALAELVRQRTVTLLKGQWLVDLAERIKLEVTILSARGLRNADFNAVNGFDVSDPYVVVRIPTRHEVEWRTRTLQDTLDPEWNHTFELESYVVGDALQFTVYDDDGGQNDDRLGWVVVPSKKFLPGGFTGTLPLKDAGKGSKSACLTVSITLSQDALQRMPRCQDVPEEAIWEAEELFDGSELRRGHEIIAVSHLWRSAKHPDPDGLQLNRLGRFVKAWTAATSGLILTRVAIFIDWCSLPQEPRTGAEKIRFSQALSCAGVWYANRAVTVFLLTGDRYYMRGWTTFEVALANLNAHRGGRVFDIGLCERHEEEGNIVLEILPSSILESCRVPRCPPLELKTFETQLHGKQFSVESDHKLVLQLYAEALPAIASSEQFKVLDFSGLSWSDVEIEAICANLRAFVSLQELNLSNNYITDIGVELLAEHVVKCPQLQRVLLAENMLDDRSTGVEKIRKRWQDVGRDLEGLVFGDLSAPSQ
eukprot:TRINITY_DN39394_c0_g1_i1.p1 TRINITY_DN39394_c0_g1~~TRINITY_DN39394_c0_g1_i1.p1  ORF type:complete len:755 (-),score=129.12 TRINITY_DN39394_c0_g1_i1:52-2283(-)